MKTENLISYFTILTILILILFVGVKGVRKHEKWECAKWARERVNYELYLPSRWQVEQCENYGIKL